MRRPANPLKTTHGRRWLIALLLAGLAGWAGLDARGPHGEAPPTESATHAPSQAPTNALTRLYETRQSGVWIELSGRVQRLLPDDNRGSRHQRFILQDPSGLTVLVAHNIDLAQSVPVRVGDSVRLLGRYEWNSKGGVLHWTHHDPDGREPGGWIEHQGRRYE